MPLNIIRNDISKVSADAIVNTANPLVEIGYGVDKAIYEAAGAEQLLAERAKIGPMSPGQAAATPAFALDAKYIIHTVGPVWDGGDCGEREAVASCYKESLRIADELHCESIAFPLISTGTYGFPKDEALQIAIREISSFLFTHDMTVYMVVYDKEAFVISGKAFAAVRSYIEEQDVKPPKVSYQRKDIDARLEKRWREAARLSEAREKPALPAGGAVGRGWAKKELEELEDLEPDWVEEMSMSIPDEDYAEAESFSVPIEDAFVESEGSLDDILDKPGETFQQMLFRIIDRKGMSDPEVYKKANLDRKLFSKIRSNEDYKPSKRTALAFAVALELNLDETADLLSRAGIALSPSSRFDRIVGYCIDHKIYDIIEINTYLFDYDEPLLVG